MTCHDARERFSEWVDGALSPEERASVDAHLAECGDCRRELDRFSATIALLERVDRPRAPVGFVDRVLEAARPVPWPVRLARKVFVPLRVKLPAEVAALLLVAGLAVYVFQRTPELQQAARDGVSLSAPSVEAPRDSGAPAPQIAGDTEALERRAQLADKPKQEAPAPADKQTGAASSDAKDIEPGRLAEAKPAPAPPEPAAAAPPKVSEAREQSATGNILAPAARQAVPAPAPSTSAPSTPPPQSTPPSQSGRGDASQAPAEGDQLRFAAKRRLAPSDVVGLLAVKDRDSAERSLSELLARSGGTLISRREESGATVLDVVVPQAASQSFTEELARVGAWSPAAAPSAPHSSSAAARSETAPLVHFTLRLVQ